ncbi:MAG: phage integrase N-terminal SAM-like domain-containing protein [Verrucomicrobiales bacterium]
MNTPVTTRGAKAPSEWTRYLALLQDDPHFKPNALPHMARWVSYWQKENGPKSEAQTRAFFSQLGQRPNLKEWHFRQAVTSVELWIQKIEPLEWARNFDWEALKDEARLLESDHRTVMRDNDRLQSSTAPSDPAKDFMPAEGEAIAIDELLNEFREEVRLNQLAVSTEQSYLNWIKRFSRFRMRRLNQGLREFDETAAAQYLEFLALERKVAPGTQKQALNAINFLAKKVHRIEEFELTYTPAVSKNRSPPTVLSKQEVRSITSSLSDPWKLACELMYGSGLRQSEALRLRVKDIDFHQGTIQIHDAKGGKHRVVPLPEKLESRLSTATLNSSGTSMLMRSLPAKAKLT